MKYKLIIKSEIKNFEKLQTYLFKKYNASWNLLYDKYITIYYYKKKYVYVYLHYDNSLTYSSENIFNNKYIRFEKILRKEKLKRILK